MNKGRIFVNYLSFMKIRLSGRCLVMKHLNMNPLLPRCKQAYLFFYNNTMLYEICQ
jgi:hypothetical protein